MPQLKDFLAQQVSVPMGIEASLPQGAPKISQVLSQIALSMPQTPDLPFGGVGQQALALPMPTDLIKGIENVLPQGLGLPELSAMAQAGARPTAEVQAAEKPATRQPVMEGGYRSIST